MQLAFDVGPINGGVGIFVAVAFFLVLATVAFIAFKLLKKSLKMAMRLVVVVAIMAIAIVGTAVIWSVASEPRARPPRTTTR